MTTAHKKELKTEKEKGDRAKKRYLETKESLKERNTEMESMKKENTRLVNEMEEKLDLTNLSIVESQKEEMKKQVETQKEEMRKQGRTLEKKLREYVLLN